MSLETIQIKPIAKNQFTGYVKPDDEEQLASIYSWAAWFRERNIPFLMFENHHGLAIWKIPAQDCVCEGCLKEFVSHEGKRILCKPCGSKLLKNLG